jgi:hypothetical protein
VTALVACETLLLVLLVLLVAGLLRSHAEILRRLGPPGDEPAGGRSELPSPERRAGSQAHDLVGMTLQGDGLKLGLGPESPPTLLAFLSSGCTVCEGFWHDLQAGRRPPAIAESLRLVALTKDPSHESPSRLRELAGRHVEVVMSSAAWSDYRVPAAPYFIYVENGHVQGEGSANGWRQIASLLRDARDDHAPASPGERRTSEVDRVLAASGIGPDDPSLYPSSAGTGADHP